MNATAAGMVVIVMQYGAAIVTAIAEDYVGQFNGAKKYKNAASPTVQMLWFSLFVTVIYFFMSQYMGSHLLSDYFYEEHGLPYYQWTLYFAACTPAISALSSFFVGIGHTRHVMVITIIGNVINLLLDPLLIFGYSTWISPLGTSH